jgi:succinate dehydrogenase/fumarate reductase flavoprotein subunit
MKKISRREFVAGAAVLAGTFMLVGCSTSAELPTFDEEGSGDNATFDVIVLGAGLAGLGAAGIAAQNGLKVAVIEKGSTLLSAFWPSRAGLAVVQIPENERLWLYETDVPDTKEAFLERWDKETFVGKRDVPYPDHDRMLNIMMENLGSIGWFENHGLPFEKHRDKNDPSGVTDCMRPVLPEGSDRTGAQLMGDVVDVLFSEKGATVMLETAGTDLVVRDGKVVGVEVEGASGRQILNAKAVVIATGGYAGSDSYRNDLIPEVDAAGCRFTGLAINTGDGITMATSIGAAMYEDGWIIPESLKVSQELSNTDTALDTLAFQNSGMLVNKEGKRFINETAGINALGASCLLAVTMIDNYQGPYFAFFDSSDAEVARTIELGLSTDHVFKGETIEELATSANMPTLVATFNTYQIAATGGNDAEFEKPADRMVSYAETGPYYLVCFVPSYVATMGGVKTSPDFEVITADGEIIEGLYAAGEITHRFLYNRSFIAAASNACGLTMGRLVGEKLVKDLTS